MANTLGQEENLMGQTVNKDGFIVPDEERNFTKLLVNLELDDNLPDMNPSIGITQPNFLKIKEPEKTSNEPIEPIKLGTLPQETDPFHIEHQVAQRVNLQFQNRFNEVMTNQINTAFAPQILGKLDLETIRSFPILQNEMEAIDEYAKSHYLTPEQVKTLKEEIIKKNFNDYRESVENTRTRQRNKLNIPLGAGGQAPPPPEGGQAPPPPPPAGGQAGGQVEGQARPPKPAAAGAGGDEDELIEQPMVFPPNPDFGQITELDQQQYPQDYINGRPKINLNIQIDANKYKNMAESYMKNYFIKALYQTSLVNGAEVTINKFLSWFVQDNDKGREKLRQNYEDILTQNKSRDLQAYFKDFVRSINASVASFANGQQLIFMDGNNIELPTSSPRQKNKLIGVLLQVLSRCRTILDKNLQIFGFKKNSQGFIVVENYSNYSAMRKEEKIYFDPKNPVHNPNYIPAGYTWKL